MILIKNLKKIFITLILEDPKWFALIKLWFKFIIYECFIISNVKWYLDNECSNRITGDQSLFFSFTPKKREFVSYGGNNKGKIIDTSIIGKFSNPKIREVLVHVLKHNLLNIKYSMCNKGNNLIFDSCGCSVIKTKSNQTLLTSYISENIYTITLNKISTNNVYLLSNDDES